MLKKYNRVTFFYFGVASIICTFYYPFLTQGMGLDLEQVSKVVAFGALFSLISQPYLSHIFAKTKDKKAFMIIYLGLLGIVNLALLFLAKEWVYVFAILYGCIALPLIGTYEIYIEKISISKGFEYSKIRKWGSIGMGSITLVGGSILAWVGFKGLHSLGLVFLSICAMTIYKKFDEIEEIEEHKKLEYKKIFSNKPIIVIFLMSFLGLGSYVGIDFAFSSYLTEITGDMNVSNQIFSLTTGSKIFLEFITFTLIAIYLKRYHLKKIFISIFILSSLRFLCISTGILPLVILGDQLHGIIFPLFLTTVFKYLRELIEDELVPSCYGIISMLMFGISNFVYPPLFAWLQADFGYSTIYRINVALGVGTCLIGATFLPKCFSGLSENDTYISK